MPGGADAGDLERTPLDPIAVFEAPEEVLRREDLSREQRVMILQRWKGMRSPGPDLLARVLRAIDDLEPRASHR